MQHSEEVGVFHPTSSRDCCPLVGSPAWLAVHAGAGHHLLLREGKLTSPVPDYIGQRSEVWEQSHSDKTLGEENKPGQEEEVKGEAADLLRASFACCCCTCYQCPSVPLTPGKGVAVSLAPSLGLPSYPERREQSQVPVLCAGPHTAGSAVFFCEERRTTRSQCCGSSTHGLSQEPHSCSSYC